MRVLLLAGVAAILSVAAADLSRPSGEPTRLHATQPIWLSEGFLSSARVEQIVARLKAEPEDAWQPCIGQTTQFASKKCMLLPVGGDQALHAALSKIEAAWDVDVSPLREAGLPIIRYVPGAPSVGVHGDRSASGLVPNATLVVYLTDDEYGSGQTFFPNVGVKVNPLRGSILSFTNVDAAGEPDAGSKHGVESVSPKASSDRIVVQIPITHSPNERPRAYPEHVSGGKHTLHMGMMVLIIGALGAREHAAPRTHPGQPRAEPIHAHTAPIRAQTRCGTPSSATPRPATPRTRLVACEEGSRERAWGVG